MSTKVEVKRPKEESSFFSAGTVARVAKGRAELLVIRFLEPASQYGTFRMRKKFPGGGGKGSETPDQAFLREIKEEIAGEGFHILDSQKIFELPVGYEYVKYFYIFQYTGGLRHLVQTEDDGDILYPPYYEDVVELHKDSMFVSDHRLALEELVLYLAKEFEAFAYAAHEMGLVDQRFGIV